MNGPGHVRAPGPGSWLLVLVIDGLAAWFLARALERRAALEGEPAVLVRGAPLTAALPEQEPPTGPAVDAEGRLDLARLVVPGYDPPEVRADPSPLTLERLPEVVQQVHGQVVRAQGYVIPVERDRGAITRFLLTRYPPGCCFGALPVLDEWIQVRHPAGIELPADRDSVVEATGRLEAGEVLDPDGYAESLYRMEATAVQVLR